LEPKLTLSQEKSKTFLQNLPKGGNCIVVYSECNFSGLSQEVCGSVLDALIFNVGV
jgi:hypothetical protein